MKMRTTVVSLSYIFPRPREDEEKKKKKKKKRGQVPKSLHPFGGPGTTLYTKNTTKVIPW